jgi:integrase
MINLASQKETTRQIEAQRESTTPNQADVKGKIVELAWHLKKQGRTSTTISIYSKYLTILMERGANLLDPESVKDIISQQEHWAVSTKKQSCTAYAAFCLKHGINWINPPNYKPQRKLPFIPLEKEIDALIASCGQKTATILQSLKETGARIGEVLALKWTDVDLERCTISINNPEKNSNPRIFKVSNKLISMVNALPKISVKVFNGIPPQWAAANFRQQRKRAAKKLQNPRLLQIHFHTLRHWKATMEYSKTNNIVHVMQMLGHKNINNTMFYTQLIQFESDEYHSAVAKDTAEAQKFIEAGFEYVCTHENLMLFRKRR